MRVVIIGAGAVGKWLAAVHLQAGNEVVLICRDVIQMEELQKASLSVKEPTGNSVYQVSAITWGTSSMNDFSMVDLYLVTVKAHHWPDFYNQWKKVINRNEPEKIPWIAVHNGFVDYQSITPEVAAQVCRSVFTYGLTATGKTSVELRGAGTWLIEEPSDSNNRNILKQWQVSLQPILNVSFVSDIEPFYWRKLLLNACLNPVTALTCLTNGQAWDNPNTRKLIKELAFEAQVVCKQALQIEVDDLLSYIGHVCAATYNNQSSMLQDVIIGRKTEIDALNGVIIQFARCFGIDVKYHQAIFHLMKAKE